MFVCKLTLPINLDIYNNKMHPSCLMCVPLCTGIWLTSRSVTLTLWLTNEVKGNAFCKHILLLKLNLVVADTELFFFKINSSLYNKCSEHVMQISYKYFFWVTDRQSFGYIVLNFQMTVFYSFSTSRGTQRSINIYCPNFMPQHEGR